MRPVRGVVFLAAVLAAHGQSVRIDVDTGVRIGPFTPIWTYFGYDEPNYTYMKDGRKLLGELAEMSPVPVYIRAHNLLTTGNGQPALKWGSTNAYTEDAKGRPVYDWTIADRIFDTYRDLGLKPLVEIGFMPKALSTHPEPYQHQWAPDKTDNKIFTGWAYPPKDYRKWADLVYAWVKHCVSRYGKDAVESWWWEVWNEPNIGYWQGTPEEYNKLYDYTADAVKRALPTARIGGPHSTGPGNEKAAQFLESFLAHVTRGKNYVTGKTGSPIDYVGFHAKGRPQFVEGHVQMGIDYQLRDINAGFALVASFAELRKKPILIGESDPEGCAACAARFHPQNAYRNGTVYSSYTAASFARKRDLAAQYQVDFRGAVTWAFEFENQPYFDGFRDLATNGLDKPVLNVFRMFGLMEGDRVGLSSSGAIALDDLLAGGVKGQPDIGGIASHDESGTQVMIWNYHDDDVAAPDADITLNVAGLPSGRALLIHYRVDRTHSNSYEEWKKMGSPQKPSPEQYQQLEKAGQLEMLGSPEWIAVPESGPATVKFTLPRQGVSLLTFRW